MSYTPTAWTNPAPASIPVKHKITDDDAGVLAESAVIELVTAVTLGTPADGHNLNHMEAGVAGAHAAAAAALADAQTASRTAATSQTAASAALTAAQAIYVPPLTQAHAASFSVPRVVDWADVTGLSCSITAGSGVVGHPKWIFSVWLFGYAKDTGGSGYEIDLKIIIDGTDYLTTRVKGKSTNSLIPFSACYRSGLYAPGTHTIKISAKPYSVSANWTIYNPYLLVMLP